MTWAKRAANNLLPLSKDKYNFTEALKEWFYSGEAYDLGSPQAECELCDHPEIKYQFGILNRFTSEKLLVGSECITKFGIAVVDEFDNVLEEKDGVKKLQRDRRKLITDAALNRVINALIELGMADIFFADKIESFIDYYKDRNGFTPKQLLAVLKGFKRNGVKYRKNDFKLKLRRLRERDQLLVMNELDVQALWGSLSSSQQLRYLKLKQSNKSRNQTPI